MSRVEELPDDFDEAVESLNLNPPNNDGPSNSSKTDPGISDTMLSGSTPFGLKEQSQSTGSSNPSAALPPVMASVRQHSADEVIKMLNRTPLFMTTLDETDGEGGENMDLEALKALAYEGTRAEIAANFKEQGNEHARFKHWDDAREFYNKALTALKGPRQKPYQNDKGEEEKVDMEVVEIDDEAEAKKEKELEETCLVNRALCNLEKRNYRSCNLDCAAALRLNPRNIKAWYRSASACLSLSKIPEAEDACSIGLSIDSQNTALKTLSTKIVQRKSTLEQHEKARREREEKQAATARNLALALKARNIRTRQTKQAPEMEDAEIRLQDPTDPASVLTFPVLLLYPLAAQTDLVKAFAETESLGQHLQYILPVPWDSKGEYEPATVECYVETVSGGLVKAGKKVSLLKLLSSGKVELVDGLLKVNVVPSKQASVFIEEFKKRRIKS